LTACQRIRKITGNDAQSGARIEENPPSCIDDKEVVEGGCSQMIEYRLDAQLESHAGDKFTTERE